MYGKSKDIKKGKIENLKKLFPEVVSEGKIDFKQLKMTLGANVETDNERYVLSWAGKSEAFKSLQTPTTATLAPSPKESVNFDTTENIFIEGENLEVLKVLQKAYYGKIKMIYIDPPYNTGNDSFIYPDKFSETKEEYLKRIGEKDEEGYLTKEGLFRKNSKENGQFHSNWLSMMYPRLFLARNLLRDDGVIFVSIDDNEVHNLRLLMNEIFGEENFFAQIIVRSNSRGQTYKQIAKTHEYILVYIKRDETELQEFEKEGDSDDLNLQDNISKFNIRELRNRNPKFGKHNRPNLFYPIYVNPAIVDKDGFSPVSLTPSSGYKMKILPLNSEGKESCWRWGKEKFTKNIAEKTLLSNLIAKKKNDDSLGIYEKYRKTTFKPKSIWDDNAVLTETGTVELKQLDFGQEFEFPKPIGLIKNCIALSSSDDDIILDFFSGSGTTAHAVFDLNKEDGGNRKFICVQMPEKCAEDSEAFKSGYKTIADICKERIRRVIKRLKEVIASETKQARLNFSRHSERSEESRILKSDSSAMPQNDFKNLDLGFKVFKLRNSNFKIWRSDVIGNTEDLEKQLKIFEKPVKPEAEKTNMLYEIMLKSGYGLNTKIKGGAYYSIASGEMVIALSKLNDKAIKEILKSKPKKCICLDGIFEGNDQLKTNTALQMKDAGIDFKTI